MNKLNAAQTQQKDSLQDRIAAAQEALTNVMQEASDFLGILIEQAETYRDDRSDAWQESEKGDAYQAWIDAMQDAFTEVGAFVDSAPDFAELLGELAEYPE